MTTKDEALKLALKKAFDLGKRYWQQANSDFTSQWRKTDVTLASFNQLVEDTIREALAEQPAQQEPVAYVDGDEAHRRILWEPSQAAFDLAVGTKLYTHPPVIDKSAAIRIATALGWEPKREPLLPQSDVALTPEQLTVFKYGWKCAESAHGIGEQ